MARVAYTGTWLNSYGNVEPGMDRGRDQKGRVPASLLEYADAHIWPHLFCRRVNWGHLDFFVGELSNVRGVLN